MDPDVQRKLEVLRADFTSVVGQPFSYFFCPILFRDEDRPLCQAHIVNAAFKESSRRWTLQRQDVDNFYGSMFESEFVDLQHPRDGIAAEAFVDPRLYKRLRPKILLEGREVEHFVANGPVPAIFSKVVFQHQGRSVQIGLKLPPGEVSSRAAANWQIEVLKDLRLATIVAVLKAAHLTLFEMLGYRYSLGPSGYYFGRILGEFFEKNVGRAKHEVVQNAFSHFSPFANMVRPVTSDSSGLVGSIVDSSVRVCWREEGDNPAFWGGVVFVRTDQMVHGVLVPMFDGPEGARRFEQFLDSEGDTLNTSVAQFRKDHWSVSGERIDLKWPAANIGPDAV